MRKSKHKWICKDCQVEFETRQKMYEHRYKIHKIKKRNNTKICKFCKQHYEKRFDLHRRICPALRHDKTHTELSLIHI